MWRTVAPATNRGRVSHRIGPIPSRTDAAPLRLVHVMTAANALVFLSGQAGYMKARGLEVFAVTSAGPRAEWFSATEGIPVHIVDMPRRITPAKDLVALWRLYRYLRQVRPEIVHAHTPKGGLLGTTAAWLARVPVRIYHMRGLPSMTATGLRRALLQYSERVSCTLAHRVLCVSTSLRGVAIHDGLCSAEKSAVLARGSGNGVDAVGRFDPARWAGVRERTRGAHGIPPDALVIGFVGRVVRDKGITELIEAWRHLREEFPTLHLLLVGPFEPQDPLPAAVTTLIDADPRIHVTGRDSEPEPFYAAMDVVALPTYREGFPNVPLEAAAMGLPVVATQIPGCTDAIEDGVGGTLVPRGDAAALTTAIRAYLADPKLRHRHGGAARERVLRDFVQVRLWEALYREYARLLGDRRILERSHPVSEIQNPNSEVNAVLPARAGSVARAGQAR